MNIPAIPPPIRLIQHNIINQSVLYHGKESAPFFRVPGKALHKRSIAILAGMCTAHIGIVHDKVQKLVDL